MTGEAGIGKTALVDAFLEGSAQGPLSRRARAMHRAVRSGRALPAAARCAGAAGSRAGQRLGGVDAGALSAGSDAVAERIHDRSAPAAAASCRNARCACSAARWRRVAAEGVLVLVLEDLHWSDPSTLDVLSYVAQRPEPCRLMVLATYRPTDVILRRHPLRGLAPELRARRRSAQLALGRLTVDAVQRWLGRLCSSPPQALVAWLHRRTDGHPLFLVTLFEALAAAGLVACDQRRVERPTRLRRVRRPGEPAPDDRSPGRAPRRRGSVPPGGRQRRRHAVLGGQRRRRGGARPRLRGGALQRARARGPVPSRRRSLAVAGRHGGGRLPIQPRAVPQRASTRTARRPAGDCSTDASASASSGRTDSAPTSWRRSCRSTSTAAATRRAPSRTWRRSRRLHPARRAS